MKLIANWRERWWKLWSIRFHALATAVTAYLWASPDMVISVLVQVPAKLRVGIIVAVFLVITISRLMKQKEVSDGPRP
jgi:hypothetical protein